MRGTSTYYKNGVAVGTMDLAMGHVYALGTPYGQMASSSSSGGGNIPDGMYKFLGANGGGATWNAATGWVASNGAQTRGAPSSDAYQASAAYDMAVGNGISNDVAMALGLYVFTGGGPVADLIGSDSVRAVLQSIYALSSEPWRTTPDWLVDIPYTGYMAVSPDDPAYKEKIEAMNEVGKNHERLLLALTILGEAGRKKDHDDWQQGQDAVARVMINRYLSDKYNYDDWMDVLRNWGGGGLRNGSIWLASGELDKALWEEEWQYAQKLADNLVNERLEDIREPKGFTDEHYEFRTIGSVTREEATGKVDIAGNTFYNPHRGE